MISIFAMPCYCSIILKKLTNHVDLKKKKDYEPGGPTDKKREVEENNLNLICPVIKPGEFG